MKKILLTAALAATASLPMFSFAGDVEAGKAKAAICAGCHGVNGKAMVPQYPHLAGQNAEYLKLAIKAYKSQDRKGGNAAVMYGMVAALTDADIDNLAAFYASLQP